MYTHCKYRDYQYKGWGTHSPDICYHRSDVEDYMSSNAHKFADELKEMKEAEKAKSGYSPQKSWGTETMKPKKTSDEKKKDEKDEKNKKRKSDKSKDKDTKKRKRDEEEDLI
ncbi:unnamed protein product [Symbiodinium sp. CCMP2592]|nr:unnamed protein product [Symbiodinium sp. CCMP2592]